MLLRLRADAAPPAHQGRREIFRRFRHTEGADGALALHVPHVPAGRVHSELPGRSGHHQPLQAAAGVENEETRRAGNAHIHDVHSNRRERFVIESGVVYYFF